MSQYINLYNAALLRRHDLLNAATVAGAAVALAVLISGSAYYWSTEVAQAARRADEVQVHLKQTQERAAVVKQAAAQRKPDALLAAEIVQAETVLKAREELEQALSGGAAGRSEGFSQHLRAFSRQSMDGVWLTALTIGGPDDMEIRGRALRAELLPIYLRRLNGETAFQGRSFATLAVNAVAEAPGKAPEGAAAKTAAEGHARPAHVEFTLSSNEQAERRP